MRLLVSSNTTSAHRPLPQRHWASRLFERIAELYERRYRLVDCEEESERAMTREEALFQMWLDENLFDR